MPFAVGAGCISLDAYAAAAASGATDGLPGSISRGCGFLLAGKIGRQRFVCGLICGAFYALCLLAAAFLVHGVPSWTRSDAMLPLALLLGGTLGGALSAIKEGH